MTAGIVLNSGFAVDAGQVRVGNWSGRMGAFTAIHDHQPFNGIAQLTNIARPFIMLHGGQRGWGQRHERQAGLG